MAEALASAIDLSALVVHGVERQLHLTALTLCCWMNLHWSCTKKTMVKTKIVPRVLVEPWGAEQGETMKNARVKSGAKSLVTQA